MPNILIIDDNPEIQEANLSHLTADGFTVMAADTGMKANAYLSETQYDCIVMDIMLPDIDGFTLCQSARKITDAPIIFLSCLDAVQDKVKGLMTGGDAYMTKPYSLEELSAQIHAVIRRNKQVSQQCGNHIMNFENIQINRFNNSIETPESKVFLAQKEFELFMLFFENPKKKFSKEKIWKTLWTDSSDIGTVAVHILKLRRKLESVKEHIGYIENDYRQGYYLDDGQGGR